ncbi:hypothetical protein FNV43_RR05915 [Rhamnella rubrinervis]|uniref:Uncharacterized protein n=1 Tax=Rhamnella rubrinervis TaxID=2594499 RepID=A0A8K0HC26_9ROSA|nr:hypothetical protein FNV43_RR05915 [Rhamnella rubrinervis]
MTGSLSPSSSAMSWDTKGSMTVETLSMDAQSRPSLEQARIVCATTFDGTTNPTEALSWLAEMEKSFDEGMHGVSFR